VLRTGADQAAVCWLVQSMLDTGLTLMYDLIGGVL
jgi:hypothetical protein